MTVTGLFQSMIEIILSHYKPSDEIKFKNFGVFTN